MLTSIQLTLLAFGQTDESARIQYQGKEARKQLLVLSNFDKAKSFSLKANTVSVNTLNFLEPVSKPVVRERLYLQTPYDDEIPVILCYPQNAGVDGQQYPAIICLSGGLENVKEDVLDVIPILPHFARHGYVTATLDRIYQGERYLREGSLIELLDQKMLDGSYARDIFGRYMFDLELLFRYIQTRPEVIESEIGIQGGSQGGFESYVFGALESDVAAVACVSGVVEWQCFFNSKTEDWKKAFVFPGTEIYDKLMEALKQGDDLLETYQKIMDTWLFEGSNWIPLIAPRPVLIVAGEKDEHIPSSREATEKVYHDSKSAYAELNAEEKLKLVIDPESGHNYTSNTLQIVQKFFDICLKH